MSAEARMQPDRTHRLRSSLIERTWSYDLLSEYVSQLSQNKHEEEIFDLLAFHQKIPNQPPTEPLEGHRYPTESQTIGK